VSFKVAKVIDGVTNIQKKQERERFFYKIIDLTQ
jgi:hypothetical protein